MGSADWIVIVAIVFIVGAAALYIIKAKKKGKRCIGCPDCSQCASQKTGGCCNCGMSGEEQ